MSDLTRDEVLKALAGAEFATAFALYLDVLVTLDFGLLGFSDPHDVHAELQRFLKAANSWLSERKLPVAWIACIERAQAGNLHAHVAMHVPGLRREGGELRGIRYRTQFRQWVREAVARRAGDSVPRAVNVRCSLAPSIISHWISVTYLLKGFDRGAVLVGARNSPDGHELLLGDILPFPYRGAGEVGLDRRLSISGNLGPARRRVGVPPSAEFMLPVIPDIHAVELVPGDGAARRDVIAARRARPFRAAVEDGVFDVRRIYGEEFAAFVTGAARAVPSPALGEGQVYNPDLLTFLQDLEI